MATTDNHSADLNAATERALAGGPERHRDKAAEQGKLPVRERIALLLDPESFSEDGLLADFQIDGEGAAGVVTGMGTIDGRTVAVAANDPTVKAGSWAPKTVEKILRLQDKVAKLLCPVVYLVDSAGARINQQVELFPGARGGGAHLSQPGAAVGRGASDLRAVRSERSGWRLRAGLLRRGDHA